MTSAQIEDLARRIDDDLSAIRRAMRQQLNKTFESGGLTGPQRLAMAVLIRQGPLALKQIAAAMNLGHSTVSGIMRRLETRSFVVRLADPSDGRISLFAPSPQVTAFLKTTAPELVRGPLARKLAAASPEDLELIETGLRRLRELAEEPLVWKSFKEEGDI
jgi:DNA-binding MarR family transcriptional regulator